MITKMTSDYKEITFKQRILQHAIFWVAIFIYSTIFFGYPNHLLIWAKVTLSIMPVDMAFVYITIYYLLPKYLLKKKYLIFVILFLILGYIDEIFLRYISFEFFEFKSKYTIEDVFIGAGSYNIFSNYYFALIAIALRLFRIWHKESELAKKNLKDKYDAELKLKEVEHNMLKAQLHPHFLFNTLNNLYALTLEKSDKSSEIVLKMSNLLHYMLYECNKGSVSLKKEIDQVLNYIALEQLRYDEYDLTINIKNDCQSTDLNIAPLLILPFVENCFKHGTSNEVGSSWINIAFSCQNKKFYMFIENSISDRSENSNEKSSDEGIGLKNVKQRLQSLYPNKHTLEISNEEDRFSATLKIEL